MRGRFFAVLFVFAVIVVTVAMVASPVYAQKAKQQLDSIAGPAGKVPDVPPPTRVETSSGTAGGYSVGTSSGTASGTSSKPSGGTSGQTKKSGTEKAH